MYETLSFLPYFMTDKDIFSHNNFTIGCFIPQKILDFHEKNPVTAKFVVKGIKGNKSLQI